MISYKKTIEAPRLVIRHDVYALGPRPRMGNVGYFIDADRQSDSPDDMDNLVKIVRDTGEEATSLNIHLKLIKERVEQELGENVLTIFPVSKYVHGATIYKLGHRHGFDYSNSSFYIITDKSLQQSYKDFKDIEEVVKSEIGKYNRWLNGEVYEWELFNEDGVEEDSGTGFYGLENIMRCLPKEWKNEDLSEYIVYQ